MSENLRKLLSSSELAMKTSKQSCQWVPKKHTNGSSIRWIPIDTKVTNEPKAAGSRKHNKKSSANGNLSDLKVFEVRFPRQSPVKKDHIKPVSFQLIPLKSIPSNDQNEKKSTDSNPQYNLPTKKLRTGSQNNRSSEAESLLQPIGRLPDRLERIVDYSCCNLDPDSDEDCKPGAFSFYQNSTYQHTSPDLMEEVSAQESDENSNAEIWFDQFSRSLGALDNQQNDHLVPDFTPAEYEELEQLLNAMPENNKENIKERKIQGKVKKEGNAVKKKQKTAVSQKTTLGLKFEKTPSVRSYAQKISLDASCQSKLFRGNHFEQELTKAMGVTKSDLSTENVLARRKIIHNKLKNGYLKFTPVEEYDIHHRAEIFMNSVAPDKNFYLASDKEEQLQAYVDTVPPPRKRRKHFSILNEKVVMPTFTRPQNDSYITLQNGTRLLRPPTKLVELVAKAINDSPDCMLQVHQVYNVLQKRFPYFQYMDKGYLTSWRSSIRHALYQKWFKKVQFSAEVINTKGCYWALNRKYTPKEWHLPPKRQEHTSLENMSKKDAEVMQEMETFDVTASFMDTLDERLSASWLDPLMAVDVPTLPSIAYTATHRDPDPMLNPHTHTATAASQDSQEITFDENAGAQDDSNSESGSADHFTQKSDDSGYFGNLLWSPLDKLAADLDPLSCYSPASALVAHDSMVTDSLTLEQLLRANSPQNFED